jgi:transposase
MKRVKLTTAEIGAAEEAARKATTCDELRMALTILVPSVINIPDQTIGRIIGRSRPSVVRLRKRFRESCAGQASKRNRGGRRYGYLTIEQELQFLSPFFNQASKGGILIAIEIKRAYEAVVGHKVAKTTIYRMLDRHGWRKIMPRPRHTKSDAKAREGLKKTPENSR